MILRSRSIPSLAALGVAACAVGPGPIAPSAATPPEYLTPTPIPVAAEGPWWAGFQDPVLDQLIDRALADNVEIGIALARLDEALALLDASRAGLFPTVDAGVSANIQSTLDGGAAGSGSADGGFGFGFLPDIFGRQRGVIEEARARADAQAFIVEDTRRLTAAAVADAYVELRRSTARLELLDTSLELQRQTLEIVQQRFEAGLSADLDVRRAESDLSRTQAQRGTLSLAQARARYALAVLLGQAPGAGLMLGEEEAAIIPSFVAGPEAGVPADLVRRRPDLRVAEADLAGAAAAIGVATAELYPVLSLSGSLSGDLGSADIVDAIVAQAGAAIDLLLFDAGERRAEIRAAEAGAQAAALAYRQTLLDSLSEVETNLVAIRSFQDRREQLGLAVTSSEQAFEQLNALYREGLATFIDILDAQRTLIGSRESFVDSEADLAAAIISLYASLGAPTAPADASASAANASPPAL
jgi:NodT family efflux transporter outer membrane factor (OMF) lipoprotein